MLWKFAILIAALGISANTVVWAQARNGDALSLPPDTMEERVRGCVSCHGQAGGGTNTVANSVYFPRLAGKPSGYLFNQLVAFRDGRRKYAPMNYLLAYLPDEYLKQMAQYYAAAQVPFVNAGPPGVSAEVLQHGRNLVLGGNPARQVPACVICHGPDLSGREPGIPGLVGLRADYITAQLGAWRYGTRTAIAPDCMQLIAARLTEADVAAAAAWLSAMPIPVNTRPLKASNERLPMKCGSQNP